jgi:hypothetical protein
VITSVLVAGLLGVCLLFWVSAQLNHYWVEQRMRAIEHKLDLSIGLEVNVLGNQEPCALCGKTLGYHYTNAYMCKPDGSTTDTYTPVEPAPATKKQETPLWMQDDMSSRPISTPTNIWRGDPAQLDLPSDPSWPEARMLEIGDDDGNMPHYVNEGRGGDDEGKPLQGKHRASLEPSKPRYIKSTDFYNPMPGLSRTWLDLACEEEPTSS